MTKNVGAGLGDPYWYEWSVGQGYVVDMLDPKSGITSVTLQQTGEKGLDDVVVCFGSGDTRFIQVKHTRIENSLTFGDLVTAEDGEPALLCQIASAWDIETTRTPGSCEAWLVTNRAVGRRRSGKKGPASIDRPPLDKFLAHLATEIANATTLADVKIPNLWQEAWEKEWMPQLNTLISDSQKLQFMRRLRICTSEEGLEEIGERLLTKLMATFAVDRGVAFRLRAFLDSALRIWATSLQRNAQAITREAVYEKLCLADDMAVGEHELAPPAPFFQTRLPVADEITSLLTSRAEPVVFVVGEPGSGKTALFSSLANRRVPVVDIRFHAYRPITPENQLLPADAGRTTSARALWSDLLLQIRTLARGHLAQLQVPIHAGSLSVESLRAHVLRLADALAEHQGRTFVIAIDGIDHAARAGTITESFLNSLIPPHQVPSHVVFLIGGQPPEGYASYPLWLRSPTPGVKRFDLPRLSFSDTLDLVRARLPQAATLDQENVARDVWQRCEGHTLSTVFALEEAVLAANDLSRLATLLDSREIALGVEAYYESIWSAATRVFPLPATRIRLAACLCLMPIRATAATVRATLGSDDGALVNYGDLLRQLRPLVVEDSTGFRVFHNDVRVFLHRLLMSDTNLYRESASRLADHLMIGEDAAARHAAAQSLYGLAGRPTSQAAVFTPTYVLEGHAIGRPLDALTEHGLVAADALASVEADWTLAHGVATGLRTLEQLRASLGWRNDESGVLSRAGESSATKLTERRVLPRTEWSPAVLSIALDDIAELHTLGERSRATGAFHRWFGGLSPAEIASASNRQPSEEIEYSAQDAHQSLIIKLGKVCAAIGVVPPASDGRGDAGDVEANFASGLLSGMVDCSNNRVFVSMLRRVTNFFLHDVQKLLASLIEVRSWMRCRSLLRSIGVRGSDPWSYRLQGAAAAALTNDAKLRGNWIVPLLSDGCSSHADVGITAGSRSAR
ncbi:AAA family ATPase [Sorangium sp. So ce1667]